MSEAETDKRSRRERRADAAKGAQQDEIKDRNQRLRAEAIAKRKADRQRELSSAKSEGLATAERVDDALVRGADTAGRVLKQNFRWLQWVIVLGIAGSMAYLVYDYRQDVVREEQGHVVGEALAAAHGRLSSVTPVTPTDRSLVDTRPEFESTEKRLEAALSRFTDLAKSPEPELRLLGKLGRAGVLYDQQKFADARGGYEDVFKNPVSARFPELRVRAAEGIALCHEAEGRLDDAAKAIGVLTDLGGQAALLGALHGARVAYEQGQVDKAKEGLVKLLEKLEKKRSADASPGYVEAAARELQKTVDPTRAAAAASGGISPEQLEALRKQFEAMQAEGAPTSPAGPASPSVPASPALPGSGTPAPMDVAPLDAPPAPLPGSELDDPAPPTSPASSPEPPPGPVEAGE